MDIQRILRAVDHTLLTQTATWADIAQVCDDGMQYQTASVCIPACFVKQAADYVRGKLPICTVIGFPNGYSTTAAKCYETSDAVYNGASEIDMVINIGLLKEGRAGDVLAQINEIKRSCEGRLLKVIIETCLLTEEEKVKMCEIVNESDADFIKTSTGFSKAGATREDIALFKRHMRPGKGIKAAGGIRSLQDAEDFLNLGATRLGTSSVVKLIKNEQLGSY